MLQTIFPGNLRTAGGRVSSCGFSQPKTRCLPLLQPRVGRRSGRSTPYLVGSCVLFRPFEDHLDNPFCAEEMNWGSINYQPVL